MSAMRPEVRKWLKEQLWLYDGWLKAGPACRGWLPGEEAKRDAYQVVRNWLAAELKPARPQRPRRRIECPACLKGITVSGKGRIIAHHAPDGSWCAASGTSPWPAGAGEEVEP